MTNNVSNGLQQLPFMQHFPENVTKQVDVFRKGEKNLFWFIKLAVFGLAGFLIFKYVLPPLFIYLGKAIALVATGAFLVFVIMMIPNIIRGLRLLTRAIHKSIIQYDPLGELANKRVGLLANRDKFYLSKAKIENLRRDMEVEAKKNERDAEKDLKEIVRLRDQAKALHDDLDRRFLEGGVKAKEEDDYVNDSAELLTLVSKSTRLAAQLEQEQNFVQKYMSRATIMKKLGQKLTMVATSMDIKIADFDATVDMLKRDYDFAEKSKDATTAAKDAILFTTGWEVEYAIECVSSAITADIAITTTNLQDIDTATKDYNLNSDDLYANLDKLANSITAGEKATTDTKKYNNPDYKLSSTDKDSLGSLGSIF